MVESWSRDHNTHSDWFSRGLLIATDVAARGLDIPNIEHVIHYQVLTDSYLQCILGILMSKCRRIIHFEDRLTYSFIIPQVPRTSESYIHRSGRTARATRPGLSLLLVDPGEQVGDRNDDDDNYNDVNDDDRRWCGGCARLCPVAGWRRSRCSQWSWSPWPGSGRGWAQPGG